MRCFRLAAVILVLLVTGCVPQGTSVQSTRDKFDPVPTIQLGPAPPVTRDYRARPAVALGPANPVYVTRSGERYHRADCFHLRKGAAKLDRKEAQKRHYTSCLDCQP